MAPISQIESESGSEEEQPREPEQQARRDYTSSQHLSSQGLFSTVSTEQRVVGYTLGDTLSIAWDVKENGGNAKAQLNAQAWNRPRL